MKHILLILLLSGTPLLFGQKAPYENPDHRAEFPGGEYELQNFLKDHISKDDLLHGTCVVRFVVAKTGKIQDVRIQSGVEDCPECDQEAIRVVKLMPNWEPARMSDTDYGRIVSSYYTLEITFYNTNKNTRGDDTQTSSGTQNDLSFPPAPPSPDMIYTFTDVMAQFPGGEAAMLQFLQENLKRPEDIPADTQISGTCSLNFIVTKEGRIQQIKIVKGIGYCSDCDLEVVRVVETMPRWIPAKIKDGAVNSYNQVEFPVTFGPK